MEAEDNDDIDIFGQEGLKELENDARDTSWTSYWSHARRIYTATITAIIKPPRDNYQLSDLGPSTFYFPSKEGRVHITRLDFAIVNPTGELLQCSWWQRHEDSGLKDPTVIYLHCTERSRVAALEVLTTVLQANMSLFALDFSGCGMSSGEYSALGTQEHGDLAAAIEYLRNQNVSKVGIWGHSVGAVAALFFSASAKDTNHVLFTKKEDRKLSLSSKVQTKQDGSFEAPSYSAISRNYCPDLSKTVEIFAFVLDSPLVNADTMISDLIQSGAEEGIRIPSLILMFAIRAVKALVWQEAKIDLNASTSQIIHKCQGNAFFGVAISDRYVLPKRTLELVEKYTGYTEQYLFEGEHFSPRPSCFLSAAADFLQRMHQRSLGQEETNVTSVPSEENLKKNAWDLFEA